LERNEVTYRQEYLFGQEILLADLNAAPSELERQFDAIP
jgi:hypothetical protein